MPPSGEPEHAHHQMPNATRYRVLYVLVAGYCRRQLARSFTGVRTSLNQLADRYLWPSGGNPVNRLIREVTQQGDR